MKDDRELIKELTLHSQNPSLEELGRIPLMESTERFESLTYNGDEIEYLKSLGGITYEEFKNKHKPK